MNLRGWEWLILALIILLLFGARRLPDLARSVGRSMKIFRSEVKDLGKDDAVPTPPPTADPAPPLASAPLPTQADGTRTARLTTSTPTDDDSERTPS
jgi:sec-independent protein translocase protein TatA